jgi:hypothetical protein
MGNPRCIRYKKIKQKALKMGRLQEAMLGLDPAKASGKLRFLFYRHLVVLWVV